MKVRRSGCRLEWRSRPRVSESERRRLSYPRQGRSRIRFRDSPRVRGWPRRRRAGTASKTLRLDPRPRVPEEEEHRRDERNDRVDLKDDELVSHGEDEEDDAEDDEPQASEPRIQPEPPSQPVEACIRQSSLDLRSTLLVPMSWEPSPLPPLRALSCRCCLSRRFVYSEG